MGDPRWTNGIDMTMLRVGDQFGIWPGWDNSSGKHKTGQYAPGYTWYNAMLGQIEDYAEAAGQAADGKITDMAELEVMRAVLKELDTGGKGSTAQDGMVTRDEPCHNDADKTSKRARNASLAAYADITCGSSLSCYGYVENPPFGTNSLANGQHFDEACYPDSFALYALNGIESAYAQKTGNEVDGKISRPEERDFFHKTLMEMDSQCAYGNTDWLMHTRAGTRNDGILTIDEFSLQVYPSPTEEGKH